MNLIIDQRNYFVVNTQSIMFWLIIKQLNDIESYRAFNVAGRCREIFLICIKQRKHWSSSVCIHTSLSLLWWTIHFQPVFDSFFFLDDTFEPHLLSEPKYDGRYVAFGKDIEKQFINIRWFSKCVDIIDICLALLQWNYSSVQFVTNTCQSKSTRRYMSSPRRVMDLNEDIVIGAFAIWTSVSPLAWMTLKPFWLLNELNKYQLVCHIPQEDLLFSSVSNL